MFKLIKFSLFFCLFVAAGYLLLGISFGEKTLYQHLVNISHTDEAQNLKSEIGKKMDYATHDIRKKATKLAIDGVKHRLKEISDTNDTTEIDVISASDKNKLQSLIRKKDQTAGQPTDRTTLNRLIHKKNQESP